MSPPTLFCFFKIIFKFYMNFRMGFSISSKASSDFCRDYAGTVNQFEEYHCLSNIKSSEPQTWDGFPFI